VQDFRSNAQHPRQWLFVETRISAGFIALDTTFSPRGTTAPAAPYSYQWLATGGS
jgi:hypothetical protein